MTTLADTNTPTKGGVRYLSAVLAVTVAGLIVGLALGYGLVLAYAALNGQETLIYNQ